MSRVSFRSKVDAWLGAVLAASAVVSAIVVFIVGVVESPLVALAVSPVLLLSAGLPLWLLRATAYTFEGRTLQVRSGPFEWRVPLDEIRTVRPTRNPLSSPALSLDRLRIDFGSKGSLMISPRDKEGFMRELEKRVPALSKPR